MTDITSRAFLLEILSWARPHGSVTEQRFCREYLDKVPGMQSDEFGNRYIQIGDVPILWSCHVDTVAAKDGPQLVKINPEGFASLAKGKPGMSLGADDGAGVWIMLNMIAAQRPGLYVFHRGEECGCLGSAWIADNSPALLEGIKAAIAFDRAGVADVITHQSWGQTASTSFAKSMAQALNKLHPSFSYRPDDTGVYTDTNTYADIVPECTNLSVGYYGQHGPREELDTVHCERLMQAMLKLDVADLVIERDPAEYAEQGWVNYRSSSGGWTYANLVEEYPELAARLLKANGVSIDDFYTEIWVEDHFDREDYRPLAEA